MKSKIKIIGSLFVISLLAFTAVEGQEKKNEQKIKIIINDGSGTKVVIDTLITDGQIKDSIRLKDGTVIRIGHPGEESDIKHSDNKGQMYVYVSADDNRDHAETKTITVVSSDSATAKNSKGGGKVVVMSSDSPGYSSGNVQYKVISDDSNDDGKSADKIIYINKGGSPDREMNETYDVFVNKDSNESSEYSTRSIIAKDGLVVTVEGNDELKVKELVKEIQQKMGVNPPASENKETVNTGTKKSSKK